MEVTTDILSPSERDRILRAMAGLCAERGYEETTVEQVAERAGVSLETFSELFADKEECMVAAVNAILGEVMAAVSNASSPDRSERDSYLLGIKAILELMAAHPSFAYLGYIGARHMGPPRVSEVYASGVGVLTATIGRLWGDSDSAAQPLSAARGAFGAAEAVVRREIASGRIEHLPRLLPDIVYGAMVPFLGQEEALRLARRGRELLRDTAWE